MSNNGLFITFEGGEGVGKSTHIKLLTEKYRAHGVTVRAIREPGGTLIAEEIRDVLKDVAHKEAMTNEAELLLMNASRAQLVREVIRPALAAGELVLCDRFYDSTIAYQGYGRQIPMNDVLNIVNFAVGDTRPDITFWLRAPPSIGMRNVKTRVEVGTVPLKDRFEQSGDAFHERVYYGFAAIAEEHRERVRSIDYVSGGIDVMQWTMIAHLNSYAQAKGLDKYLLFQ